jgi:hypothetical protein
MRGRTFLLLVLLAVASGVLLWRTRAPVEPEVAATAPEPAPTAPRKKKRTAPAPAGLVRPEPKPCLGTVEAEGEAGMAASEGLSYDEARASLNAFAPELVSCIGPDESPTGALLLRITVACTGLVDRVTVADRGDWSAEAAACVTDRLTYAGFPAHGLPDGDVIDWPLRYTPP